MVSFLEISPPNLLYVSRPPYFHMLHPSRPSWFVHLNYKCWVHIMKLLTMQFSPIACYLLLLKTLFLNTLSVCPSLNVQDQVKHPYKTSLIIFIFLCRNWRDKIFCTKWEQAFREFNLLLFCWCTQFWFLTVSPECLEFVTFSEDLLLPPFYCCSFSLCSGDKTWIWS